jgi:hypothetical protein
MALDVEALFTGVPLIMRSGSTGSGSVRRRQRGGRDAAFARGGEQCRGIDIRASRGVDQQGAGLQRGQLGGGEPRCVC